MINNWYDDVMMIVFINQILLTYNLFTTDMYNNSMLVYWELFGKAAILGLASSYSKNAGTC